MFFFYDHPVLSPILLSMFRITTTRQRTHRTTERVASNTITGGSENLNSGGQNRFDNCARMTFAILKLCQICSGSVEDDNLQFEILRQLAQMCSRIFERAALSSFDIKSESKWKWTQILVPCYMMRSLSCLISPSSNFPSWWDICWSITLITFWSRKCIESTVPLLWCLVYK